MCLKGVRWKLEVRTGNRRVSQRTQQKSKLEVGNHSWDCGSKKNRWDFSISNVIKSKGKRNLRSFMDCFKVGGQWTTVHDHVHLNKDSTSTPADRPSTKALHMVKLKNNNPSQRGTSNWAHSSTEGCSETGPKCILTVHANLDFNLILFFSLTQTKF